MKIFEVRFDNGCSYEDKYVTRDFYETLEEAREKYNSFSREDDSWLYDDYPSVSIYELELGTQKLELIERRDLFVPEPMVEEEDIETPPDERLAFYEKCSANMPVLEKTTIGDLDALRALRDKLAGK